MFAYTISVGDQDFERLGWADPNYFSCIIGIGLLLSFYNLLNWQTARPKVEKYLYIASSLLSLFVVITSASRGAAFAILGSILMMLLMSNIRLGRKVGAIIICLVIFFFAVKIGYFDMLFSRLAADDGTAGNRTLIWEAKWEGFISNDLFHQLFGLGIDKGRKLGFGQIQGFHNDYLAFLVCYGFVGLLLFLVVLLYPIFKSRKSKPLIVPLIAYLLLVCVSLEPFTSGSLVYYYFYLYVLLVSRDISVTKQL